MKEKTIYWMIGIVGFLLVVSILNISNQTGKITENQELEPGAINACNACNYIGQEITIQGKIVDTFKYKNISIFLNFEKPYPNSCFTALIWSLDWNKFPKDPEDYYYGKIVRITGEVIEYEGAPEIILKDMSQIEIVR